MPTLNELLEAKANRLESVPGKFASEIEKVQLQLLEELQVILATFDLDADGNFIISEANLKKAAELDVKLRQALDASEYSEAVTEFAKQFNVQVGVSDVYFSQAFKGFETSEIGKMVVRQAQKNAVDLLINTSIDSDFIIPIKQQIENAIVTGARFRETLEAIRQVTVGDAETEGKILRYSKQIAHDTFAVADRSYASAVADQIGAEWFKYSGGVIKTSRPFCRERHNQYFHKKEIELWGAGKKTEGFETPDSTGHWTGEMEGTNEKTIFAVAGGYNCMHSIMAVSVFSVPKTDVQRAIDLGYYQPGPAELELLDLNG